MIALADDLGVEPLEQGSTLVSEWEALADRVDAPPFLHPGWTFAWFEAFRIAGLCLVTVRRDGDLVAALPMQRCRSGLRSPVSPDNPMSGAVCLDEEAGAALLEHLFTLPDTKVELTFIDALPFAIDTVAESARRNRRLVWRTTVARSPYIELIGDIEQFDERLSRNRRKGMRRHRRKLEAEGELSLEVNDGGDRLDSLLDEHFALEASGWKGKTGTAIASNPETRAFYTNLARWASDRDWFRLVFLRLSGRPIACDYALVHNGVLYTLKAGYDESYRSFGPGALLLHDEIAYCFEQGLERIDLLGNEEPFKLSWTDRRVENASLRAFRRNPAGLAAWGYGTTRFQLRRAASRVKNSFHSAPAAIAEVTSLLHVVG